MSRTDLAALRDARGRLEERAQLVAVTLKVDDVRKMLDDLIDAHEGRFSAGVGSEEWIDVPVGEA